MKRDRIQWSAVCVVLLTVVVVGAGLSAAGSTAGGQKGSGSLAGIATTSQPERIAGNAPNITVQPRATAWPMAAVDAGNTRHLDTMGPNKPLTERWQFKTKDERFTQQVVADGTIYFGGVDRSCTPDPREYPDANCRDHAEHVYAVDAETGQERWRLSLGDAGLRAPAVVDGTVYVPSTNGVFALDADTGAVQWQTEIHGLSPPSPPIIVDETVYVSVIIDKQDTPNSWDGRTYALDSSTGEARWTETTTGFPERPAVVDGTVFIGGDDTVYALDARTGNRRWTAKKGAGLGSPTVAHGLIYISDNSKNTYALDAQTGEEQWAHKGRGGAAVGGNTVYLTRNGKLYAVDAKTGTRRWSVQGPNNTPVVVNGIAYVAGGRTVQALNTENGNEVARFTVENPEAKGNGGPTVVDGSLYIAYRFGDTRSNPNLFNDTRLFALGSPEFSYSNLSVSPQAVAPGKPVTVTATVHNTGNAPGMLNATLVVNGTVVSAGEAPLAGGAQRTVQFNHVFRKTGTYSIGINQLSQTITVTTEPSQSPISTKTDATPTAAGGKGETTTSPTATQTTTATDTSTPGFGVGVVVFAVLVGFGMLGRSTKRN